MPASIDPDIRQCLDVLIGCIRELQKNLWDFPTEDQQEAIKQMAELNVMENTIAVFRRGNYAEARNNRPESEKKYLD